MEDSLGPENALYTFVKVDEVLILVVMEDSLGPRTNKLKSV